MEAICCVFSTWWDRLDVIWWGQWATRLLTSSDLLTCMATVSDFIGTELSNLLRCHSNWLRAFAFPPPFDLLLWFAGMMIRDYLTQAYGHARAHTHTHTHTHAEPHGKSKEGPTVTQNESYGLQSLPIHTHDRVPTALKDLEITGNVKIVMSRPVKVMEFNRIFKVLGKSRILMRCLKIWKPHELFYCTFIFIFLPIILLVSMSY